MLAVGGEAPSRLSKRTVREPAEAWNMSGEVVTRA